MRDSKNIHQINNVVPMERQNQRMVKTRLEQLPATVSLVHVRSKQVLLERLKIFFDQADDSLFEMADRADSNQEQNIFFESMREVRVQRRSIEIKFSDAVDFAFSALSSAGIPQLDAEEIEPIKSEALSLVQDDDLEEMVAVDSAAARATNLCGEEIQYISLRLDSLVPVKVYQKNNPIGPESICSAFMDQLKDLNISIKAKLILFRLFDKTVVSVLPKLYETINDLLIEQNILPSLNMSSRVSQGSGRNSRNHLVGRLDENDSDENTFGTPQDLGNMNCSSETREHEPSPQGHSSGLSAEVMDTLNALFGKPSQATPTGRSRMAGSAYSNESSDVSVQTVDLLQLLTHIQHQPVYQGATVKAPSDTGTAQDDAPSMAAIDIRSLIRHAKASRGVSGDIGRLDDEVMNLVTMLFDFILEDRNLAPTMKALISRMQIPIIKVAISDKTFFTKGGHIARRLLNEMATAAIGWTGDVEKAKKDPLYKKMDTIVHALLNDFETDVSIFSELFADFKVFREKEKKRVAILERRTLDAEDGKAKAEMTRKKIAEIIESRTEQMALPEVVMTLINDAWNNVLFVTALKMGFDSEAWTKNLRTMDELIWSCQPPETDKQRQALIRLVPGLLKKLRAGLDIISFNPFEMSKLFKSLEEVHLACIRGRAADQVRKKSRGETELSLNKKTLSKKLDDVDLNRVDTAADNEEKSFNESDALTPNKNTRLEITEQAVTETSDLASVEELELDINETLSHGSDLDVESELDLNSTNSANVDADLGPKPVLESNVADEFIKTVESFNPGSWFDMTEESGEHVRCRLAALIKATGQYIFVNRSGMKVADKSKDELALALKDQKLVVLDSGMLFDRALENVVSSLRKR